MTKMSNISLYSLSVVPLISFTFGMSLTTFEILKQTLLQHISNEQWDYTISIYCLSALVSNLTINQIKCSIKTKIMLAQVCFILGTIVLCIYKFFVIMIGRFLHGLGAGIVCCIVPYYLDTLSTGKRQVGFLHQIGSVTGVLVGQIMSWYFDDKNIVWPFVIILTFMFTLMAGLCFVKNIVKREAKRKSIMDLIKNRFARKSLVVSVIFHVGQQLSCINGVLLYSNTILEKGGDAKLKTVYVGVISLLSLLVALIIVEKAGRKVMFLLSCLICCLSLAIMSFDCCVIYMLFIFMFGFNIGLGPVAWLAVGEIFDEEYKSAGIEIAVGANWISNYGTLILFIRLMGWIGMSSFLLFAVALICVMALIGWLFEETKGKPSGFLN